MRHEMKLFAEPFRKIYDGFKTIELRLFDDKRKSISVGDEIIFSHADNPSLRLKVTVTALHRFDSFAGLYAALPLDKCGYTPEEAAHARPEDMLAYYSLEEQEKYGVIGIEFDPPRKPFRDFYRFEPFGEELARIWSRLPDWRFGQLMINFRYWLEQNRKGDGFYLEDDEYIRLLGEYVDSLFAPKDGGEQN